MTSKRYTKVRVTKSFFRNGDFIRKGEIVYCSKSATKQLIEENLGEVKK